MFHAEFFRLDNSLDGFPRLRIKTFPGILLGLLGVCRVDPNQLMHRHDLGIATAMTNEIVGVAPEVPAGFGRDTIIPLLVG